MAVSLLSRLASEVSELDARFADWLCRAGEAGAKPVPADLIDVTARAAIEYDAAVRSGSSRSVDLTSARV